MEYPPNDDNQPYFATPTNKSNTYYPQPDTDYPLHQPSTYPYQPPQAPIPPTPPKKKTKGWHILLAIIVFWVVVMISIFSAHSSTPPSSTDATTSSPTTQPTMQPSSIVDQVKQVLGGALGSDDTVTEKGGVVTIHQTINASISTDVVATGVVYVYTDEKEVWQANILGITDVVAEISAMDSNGTPAYIVQAAVSADTGNSLLWDSLSPLQAWKQYNLTWLYGEPGLNGN